MAHDECWRNSYDAWKTDPGPMPSVDEPGVWVAAKRFEDDSYAASFEQDVLNAVQRLGWARVNVILDKCREG